MKGSLGFARTLILATLPLILAPTAARSDVPAHAHASHSPHEPGESNPAHPMDMGPSSIWQDPSRCGEMGAYDLQSGMCQALPMPGMPMRMLMVHGSLYGSRVWNEAPRGASAWTGTGMLMGDLGASVGDHRHYLNLEVMLTPERWTLPSRGYPLLLQVGEENHQGQPYLDAQHPHSSPLMGLTLSDTIGFGSGKDRLKLFFAPRGEATDGPLAFMHRVTGTVNPSAPLGHHVGQDVGHISSTVMGAALTLGQMTYEVSAFHGAEPEPEEIDLPIGRPDSFSVRVTRFFSPGWMAMISASRVGSPEHHDPGLKFLGRYSASAYYVRPLGGEWVFHHTLIAGGVSGYERAKWLSSLGEEFLLRGSRSRIWGRIEALQRTPAQLAIASREPDRGQWVASLTLGYTHRIAGLDLVSPGLGGEASELGLGASVSRARLPSDLIGAYGGNPWSAQVFLRVAAMGMTPW